jgi:hypothetical protein
MSEGVVGLGLEVGKAEVVPGRGATKTKFVEGQQGSDWTDGLGFLILFLGAQLLWAAGLGYGVFLLIAAVW